MIAVDTGETLVALHSSGSAHGGLSTDTVVLGGDGRVLVSETGYAHALSGTTPGPGHDTTGWVKMLRALATPRPADDAKRLLNEAAEEAEAVGGAAGLATALTHLSDKARQVAGYGERSALAMLASLVPIPGAAPTMPSLPATIPPPPRDLMPPPPRLEEGETVALATVPVAPGAPPNRTAPMQDPLQEQETLQPAQLAQQMERRKEDVLRFGRGVASLPPPRKADASWEAPPRPRRPKPWRARIIGILSTLLTLALVAYVGYQIIQRLIPLRVGGATVALAEPLDDKCDVQARVVGTIHTNGAAGTITYRWRTSDGKTTGVLAEQVNLGTDQVHVPLLWTFSGKSTIQAKATLHILTPSELEASTEFTYSCK
jgi:hypothetical protein